MSKWHNLECQIEVLNLKIESLNLAVYGRVEGKYETEYETATWYSGLKGDLVVVADQITMLAATTAAHAESTVLHPELVELDELRRKSAKLKRKADKIG